MILVSCFLLSVDLAWADAVALSDPVGTAARAACVVRSVGAARVADGGGWGWGAGVTPSEK